MLAMQTAVLARAILSVALSVCPSITFRCFVPTNEDTIVRFSASGRTRCSAIAERVRCREHNSFGQSGRLKLGAIFYGHYRSTFNHCDIIGLKIYRIWRKNAKYGLLQRSRSRSVPIESLYAT